MYTCIPFFRIFDTEAFFQETGLRVDIDFSSLESSWKSSKKLIDIATLDQILRLTPQLQYAMEGCVLRRLTKGQSYKDVNESEIEICKERIILQKEVFDNRVCYVSTFIQSNIDVIAESVIYDPIDPLVVKSIKFNTTLFDKAGFATVFVAPSGTDSIHREYRLAPRIDLDYDPKKQTKKFKRVGVQYYQVRSLLPFNLSRYPCLALFRLSLSLTLSLRSLSLSDVPELCNSSPTHSP